LKRAALSAGRPNRGWRMAGSDKPNILAIWGDDIGPALLGDGRGRRDRGTSLGSGRQATDRGHRSSDQEAHGDTRRRGPRARAGLPHRLSPRRAGVNLARDLDSVRRRPGARRPTESGPAARAARGSSPAGRGAAGSRAHPSATVMCDRARDPAPPRAQEERDPGRPRACRGGTRAGSCLSTPGSPRNAGVRHRPGTRSSPTRSPRTDRGAQPRGSHRCWIPTLSACEAGHDGSSSRFRPYGR
jgi:hypothetical protein